MQDDISNAKLSGSLHRTFSLFFPHFSSCFSFLLFNEEQDKIPHNISKLQQWILIITRCEEDKCDDSQTTSSDIDSKLNFLALCFAGFASSQVV